ncbi:Gldg family protein [Haloferula sp. BvORR071]|uniref:DUF7088 domain-containing protein n=1 Tax=Haloferula sp. BvORR071 TaxID=1396141 RepID=UPI0005514DE2|nr:Gldg family protein [Haloferula sp. BvORR071]
MSSESDSPPQKAAKPIRRFGIGVLSITQVICMLILYVTVNYLGSQNHAPMDLSSEAVYTLSPATQRYLRSPVVQERTEPIRMLVAFRRSNPMYEKVRVLAEEYKRISNDKVKLELLDPVRSPDRAQQVVDQFGPVYSDAYAKTIFNTDLIIFDARTKEEREKANGAGTALAQTSPHIRFIEAEMMARFETDQMGQRKVTGFRGEDAMTAGLLGALEGKARTVYLLVDKSGYTAQSGDDVLVNFEKILLTQNATVKAARMADLERLPDDAAAVAIINPTYDFNASEIKVLEQYWQRERSGIFITLGANETPANLRAFLRNQGITPGNDRVLTTKGEQVITTVRGVFEQGWAFTEDFADKSTLLEGATCSLTIRDKNNEELTSKGIMPLTLLSSAPEFWAETRFTAPNPTFQSTEDTRGPVALAGGVVRGSSARDDVGNKVSKLTVIGNSDFLSPKHLSDINRNFVASSMNWLMGREELTGAGPLTLGTYKLPLLDSQLGFINRVNIFFLPAFALLIGAIVWSSRRA